jgi:hypothetical protein
MLDAQVFLQFQNVLQREHICPTYKAQIRRLISWLLYRGTYSA